MVSVSPSPVFCKLLKQGSTREKLESDVWGSSQSSSPLPDMSDPHFQLHPVGSEYDSAGTSYRASGGARWAVNPRSEISSEGYHPSERESYGSDAPSHILATTLPVNVVQRRHSAFFDWRGGAVERESMESRSDVEYMENFRESELLSDEKEPGGFMKRLSSFGCFGRFRNGET